MKSKKYKNEIKRVKNKKYTKILLQLRDNKSKDPKAYWRIQRGNKTNIRNEITIDNSLPILTLY